MYNLLAGGVGCGRVGYMSDNYIICQIEPNTPFVVKQYKFGGFVGYRGTYDRFKEDFPNGNMCGFFGREEYAEYHANRMNERDGFTAIPLLF